MERLRPIMFVGTASDVGKSVITTGFCRIFKQDGYHPAPFKAQNMSLNSYATPDGLEIGRAQAVQAEACGIDCHTDMNPLLLKPVNDKSSQVVLHGKPAGNFSAAEYFHSDGREVLFSEVKKAYHRLADRYSPIVMEGAGSISELNLKHRDVTNMRMAVEAGAATYLVADIDRGGVFASCYGTMALLEPEEKKYIKGIIINKFRGDPQLFREGKKQLEELCQVPVIGVVPFFRDIVIEEEDSVALADRHHRSFRGKVNIAVVLVDRLSNYTDFSRLEQDPRVHLFYTREAGEIGKADIVILPGSKNTIEDLVSLRAHGVTAAIQQAFADQKTVIGICGGYQMMGERIEDPLHMESGIACTEGLGLLPVSTVLRAEKTTRQSTFRFRGLPEVCRGYEIHMGETKAVSGEKAGRHEKVPPGEGAGSAPTGEPESPLNTLTDGSTDGYFLHQKCWGTYLHGILDNAAVVNELLAPYTRQPGENFDHLQYKEEQYEKLAALLRQHLAIDEIYKTLQY
ncbi:MAG TPA: cobyric acid synthase [Puia sp.]|nr:cobyric acid synthase [Puia sp.]